jgi:hypothetical protein
MTPTKSSCQSAFSKRKHLPLPAWAQACLDRPIRNPRTNFGPAPGSSSTLSRPLFSISTPPSFKQAVWTTFLTPFFPSRR